MLSGIFWVQHFGFHGSLGSGVRNVRSDWFGSVQEGWDGKLGGGGSTVSARDLKTHEASGLRNRLLLGFRVWGLGFGVWGLGFRD